MAVHLCSLLILTGLTGVYSISKVSKVSVKSGDSITIPCVYRSVHRDHVKYLCKGYSWTYCTYAVKTNSPDMSGKFSIADDKNQEIFTVTINRLTYEDTDYWCTVEISGIASDIGEDFHLAVTDGKPLLSVDHQEIKGFNGDDITISCYHSPFGKMHWCKLGRNCITGLAGEIDGTGVTINSSRDVFTVTMRNVTIQSSGWYLCVRENLQMPVHVTVTERPVINTIATTICGSAAGCGETEGHSSSVVLQNLIIPLSLLIFIVMVALIIILILKKHKSSRSKSSAMAERPCQSDVDVLYSSVVIKKPQTAEVFTTQDVDVTYSTLTLNNS